MSIDLEATCKRDFFDNAKHLCFRSGSTYVFEYDESFDKTHPFSSINEQDLHHYLSMEQFEEVFEFSQEKFDFLFVL